MHFNFNVNGKANDGRYSRIIRRNLKICSNLAQIKITFLRKAVSHLWCWLDLLEFININYCMQIKSWEFDGRSLWGLTRSNLLGYKIIRVMQSLEDVIHRFWLSIILRPREKMDTIKTDHLFRWYHSARVNLYISCGLDKNPRTSLRLNERVKTNNEQWL